MDDREKNKRLSTGRVLLTFCSWGISIGAPQALAGSIRLPKTLTTCVCVRVPSHHLPARPGRGVWDGECTSTRAVDTKRLRKTGGKDNRITVQLIRVARAKYNNNVVGHVGVGWTPLALGTTSYSLAFLASLSLSRARDAHQAGLLIGSPVVFESPRQRAGDELARFVGRVRENGVAGTLPRSRVSFSSTARRDDLSSSAVA